MAERPDLFLVAGLREAVELVHDEQVSARAAQQQIERGVEVKQADQGEEIGYRLMIGEQVVCRSRARARQARDAEQDEVSDLMRDRIEAQSVGVGLLPAGILAHLEKAISGLGIVPGEIRDDL